MDLVDRFAGILAAASIIATVVVIMMWLTVRRLQAAFTQGLAEAMRRQQAQILQIAESAADLTRRQQAAEAELQTVMLAARRLAEQVSALRARLGEDSAPDPGTGNRMLH
ncbi:MAG TPA: hypothetical protein VEY95_04035 [Azospirillaceae bacterium]|nr:hypothetical protein [Azospirillaceae bacterium]